MARSSKLLISKKSFNCAPKSGTGFGLLVAGLVVNQFAVVFAGNRGVIPLFDVFFRHAEVNVLLFSDKRFINELKRTTAVRTFNTIHFVIFRNRNHFTAF